MSESGTGREQIISIHAPREGGDRQHIRDAVGIDISIHAPREGGDCPTAFTPQKPTMISIHAPREGGDSWVQ